MTLCAILVVACGRPGGSQGSAEEEEKTAQVTVWSERFEIFLEHRLIVVKTPTRFITHVTDLETLEPRREGPLTFVFGHGSGAPLTHVEPKPARDGIYLPEMSFPTAGEWQMSLVIPLAGHDYRVELPPVMVFATKEEAANAPEGESPEGISFLKEQQWKILTKTEPVITRAVTERLRLSGVVSARPGHQATVTPPVTGQLLARPGGALPQLGSRVEAGEVLALVQPHLVGSELVTFLSSRQQMQAQEVELTVKAAEAETDAIRARVAATQAEQTLQRVQALHKQNLKSARELEEAEFAQRKAKADLSAAEALKATYERARKQLSARPRTVELDGGMPGVELRAPITGLITAVKAALGEHVYPERALFTILDAERVLIEAQIPEWDLGRLSSSHGATYEPSDAPGTFLPILGEGGGRLVYLGPSVDPKTRTVALVYEVPNPQGRLRIGMALQAYVETTRAEDALVVPVSALVDEDGRTVAFVQLAGETFEKRDLTLGIRDGPFVQVLSGLAAGERVVTKGAYAVRLASVSTTIPAHGHAHGGGPTMIDGVIRWSLHNRAAVIAVALVLTGVGVDIARRMPVDVFPDLTAPTVTIITEAHGMAPVEVESQVTFPIEAAVNGASGVRRVRSSTAVGISVVWVEFDWGTDIYAARQIVSEKVLLIAGDLPPGVGRPILAPISSIMGEILFLGLTSDRHSGIELRTVAETTIRRRLLSVPGVSQVTPIGGGEKQYQVVLSPAKLQAYGLSLNQVRQALAASNENVSAGFLVSGGSEYLVTGVGRLRTSEDIAQAVVAAVDGVPVRIADLGVVRIDEGPKRGEGSVSMQPGVILGVQKQPGANTLALTRTLDTVLDDLQAKLPEGMRINRRLFRQADFIDVAVENVLHALRDGGILVILVVLLFLANLRATVITLTAIPLSLLVAILALKAFGASINTMTLGGMAIAIGALVDDAVIDVENVFRRLRENAPLPDSRRRPALQVVYEASVEIRSSIVFATLVIILVFLPLFFLAGVEGRLLQPLGIAYVVSLVASLIVAVTTTPVLCSLLLPQSRAVQRGEEPRLVRTLKAGYAHLLERALRAPWLVTAPAVLLLGVAVVASSHLGRAFLADFNEGALTISAVTLPGTSLAESDALGRAVEQTLLAHPEVISVARRTGRAELDEHAQGVEAAELDVALAVNGRNKAEFLDALRRDFSLIPGMNITIGQPISHRIDHMLSGTRANVAVKIFGPDLYTLRALGENARRAMATVPGVVDLSVEQQLDIPILRVRFERQALAQHGVMVEDVAHTLEAALQGLTVSRVLEGPHAFDLVLRLHERDGWTPERLGDLLVDTPVGAKIPLRALAEVTKTTGPNTISREQVERKIVVMCNVAGRDVASVVRDITRLVDPMIAARSGYAVSYGGQFESAEEAGRLLSLLGVAVIIGIAFLLYLAFGSARDAALVMVNLPLALIGGVAGVFISGGVLSVASLIGFITVFGIATRNGIMLVSHIRHLQAYEGVSELREAVFRGSMERLAPILMTALAAGLALIPLAIGGEKPGNEIQTPMAIVILFGLLSSMALNMVIVPALYLRFGKPVRGTKERGEA